MEKIKEYILIAIVWCYAYFAPTFGLILLVGFLVGCDAVTGILAAQRKKEPITSRKLMKTVSKFLAYGVAILVGHVICRQFIPEFPGLELLGGFIAFVEVKSIDENIKKITGYSLFSTILEKLKSKNDKGN